MKVWISRDKDNRNIDVAFFGVKPEKDIDGDMFSGEELLFEMRAKWFTKTFGFTPRKGSCKRYELTLEEIK